MDLCASYTLSLCTPIGAFLPISEPKPGEADKLADDQSGSAWAISSLNPQFRINSLDNLPESRWHIDGVDSQGTQFFVRPTFLQPLIPNRVDVLIPAQHQHPPHLRFALGSAWGFCLRDYRINAFGIAVHLKQALEHWTREVGEAAVRAFFSEVPFGSRVVLENIAADPKRIRIKTIKDFGAERQMLSWRELQSLWSLPVQSWPPAVLLSELHLVNQIHDTVALVMLPERLGGRKVAFKTSTVDLKYMYHELKLLLTMEPHRNVMPKPQFIVVKEDRYGGDPKICGFILPYFQNGNLADVISSRKELGTLELKDQFKWARQVVETLRSLNAGPAGYYSELKADNLLLSDNEDVVFIDFEQMGNWITYSAPEIHYFEYLSRLARAGDLPVRERPRYERILVAHQGSVTEPTDRYDNPPQGYYSAWNRLDKEHQELAEVYSLGKLLWCIFEGCADTRNSVLKAFKHDTGQEFPEFRRTPPAIQTLIAQCTQGSKDWAGTRLEVVRRGAQIYPRGRSGWDGEPKATHTDAVVATQIMWTVRVKEMEQYLEAQLRHRDTGHVSEEDLSLLGYPLRPTLKTVSDVLQHEESKLLKTHSDYPP